MVDIYDREQRRKLWTILLLSEFVLALAEVVVSSNTGWPAINHPLQGFGGVMVLTIIVMVITEYCNLVEREAEEHHSGTYHEYKT